MLCFSLNLTVVFHTEAALSTELGLFIHFFCFGEEGYFQMCINTQIKLLAL